MNISATILKRLNIQKALKENPFDIEAHKKLQECDENIKLWSKSGVKPEQFTGEKMNNILKREDLAGGYHAWVKKVSATYNQLETCIYKYLFYQIVASYKIASMSIHM